MEEERFNNEARMELVAKFETMLSDEETFFFDVSEVESIAAYYFEIEEPRKALSIIEIGEQQHPSSENIILYKGEALIQLGRKIEAVEVLEYALDLNPLNGNALRILATIYAELLEHEKAIAYFEKAITFDLDFKAELYLDLAYQYQTLGRFKKALFFLKEALELNRENETALFEVGLCYNELDLDNEAVQYFEAFLEQQPYSYMGWFNLGNSYYRMEQYKDALFAFDYSVLTNNAFAAAYYGKANAYIQLDEYKKAIEILNLTFGLEQPHAFVYCHIGECYEKLGEYEKAITFYEKSLELDNDQTDAWLGIGVVKDLNKQPEEGVKFVRKALEKDPENVEYLYIYAEILGKLGETEKSKKIFRRVVDLDPDNIDAWLDYSNILFEKSSPKDAAKLLKDAIALNGDQEELQYRLVAYQISVGDSENAKINLRKALSTNYKGHEKLFEFYPQAKDITEIVDIIADYKK